MLSCMIFFFLIQFPSADLVVFQFIHISSISFLWEFAFKGPKYWRFVFWITYKNVDKYQTQLFPVLCFSLQYQEMAHKMSDITEIKYYKICRDLRMWPQYYPQIWKNFKISFKIFSYLSFNKSDTLKCKY